MGGDGGGGGYATTTDGQTGLSECAEDHGSDAGGGGGGVGRIRINTVMQSPAMPDCLLSPAPTTPALTRGDVSVLPTEPP